MLPVRLTAALAAPMAAIALAITPIAPAEAQPPTPAATPTPAAFVLPLPPGQLVDVGGRRLHIRCVGPPRGPVVIFEAGLSGYSAFATYTKAQEAVGEGARVCTYDRAGLGWSDPAPSGRTLGDLTADLHRLTRAAKLRGPYVLVGHSFGGLIVRAYAKAYPREVGGLVLADATPVDVSPQADASRAASIAQIDKALVGARPGVPVVTLPPATPPDVVRSALPEILRTERDEFGVFERSRAALQALGPLGDLPLIVLRRGAYPDSPFERAWRTDQEANARLSTNSLLILAAKSGHVIPYDDPQIVADAIRRVLAAHRTHGRLAPA